MSSRAVAPDLLRVLPDVDPRRVVGVDVARALALLGMMATHLLPGRIGLDVPWPQQLAGGRASALFAVLAGVSVALVSGRTQPVHGLERYAVRLAVRAVAIGALGLALGLVPSGIAVILAFYAVLFLLGLPFVGKPAGALAAIAVVWAICMPVISHVLRPLLPPHQVGSPRPGDLLHPAQLGSELLVTGYYPALVWLAYLLAGMAIGRCRLGSTGVAVRLVGGGVALALAATLASRALLSTDGARAALSATYPDGEAAQPSALDALLTHGLHGTTPAGSWWWLATVAPHSGTPFDLAQTTGSAMAVLGTCLLLARPHPRPWAAVFGAGAMTLSLYTLHVLVMARGHWPDLESPGNYGDQVLLVLGIGAFFALVPLRGPLEWIVGRASGRAATRVVPSAGPTGTAAYPRIVR
jgi:uncharacterized membrane protein